MPDGGIKASLTAVAGGRPALDTLRQSGDGRLAAVFDHSFYIAFNHGWVCIGTNALPLGPLNVRSTLAGNVTWASCGLRVNDRATESNGAVRLGRAVEIVTDNAAIWDPPAPPAWTAATLKAGLESLYFSRQGNEERGLGDYVLADEQRPLFDRVAAAAQLPIAYLSAGLRNSFLSTSAGVSDGEEAVIALLGLGPGLTPSGDDFLGGMVIALHALGADETRSSISTAIGRHAAQRTNAISIAHLGVACAGSGHQALHEILNSLLCGDTKALPAQLAAIDRIGHSSGWDALAGVCVTLRAYLAGQGK